MLFFASELVALITPNYFHNKVILFTTEKKEVIDRDGIIVRKVL